MIYHKLHKRERLVSFLERWDIVATWPCSPRFARGDGGLRPQTDWVTGFVSVAFA